MLGIIPRPLHAVLDYLWGVAHFMAPELLGYADDEAANLYSKVRGGSMIPISLMTRYELGLVKVIPFNAHLAMDLLGALAGLASPWLLGFAKNEKALTAAIGFSLFELGAVLLSKRDKS
ncbi:MAG TPA: hypothetical protein VM409_07395 [Chloroflexia bacterium]|nr:hypothetical protein [Chloroflexia bacterium]